MTTTNELIDWLNVESILAKEDNSPIAASRLRDSAQRLRELDKPDCVWVRLPLGRDANGKSTYSYDLQCLPIDGVDSLPMVKNKFCPFCGGLAKEST